MWWASEPVGGFLKQIAGPLPAFRFTRSGVHLPQKVPGARAAHTLRTVLTEHCKTSLLIEQRSGSPRFENENTKCFRGCGNCLKGTCISCTIFPQSLTLPKTNGISGDKGNQKSVFQRTLILLLGKSHGEAFDQKKRKV